MECLELDEMRCDRRDEAMVREKSGKRVEDRVEYA
jgi:hypothetical protein